MSNNTKQASGAESIQTEKIFKSYRSNGLSHPRKSQLARSNFTGPTLDQTWPNDTRQSLQSDSKLQFLDSGLIHRQLLLPETLEDEIKAGFFEFRRRFSTNEPSQFFISHALLHQKHPFFRKLSIETVKYLISQHIIKNLDPGQQLYGPEQKRFVRNLAAKPGSHLLIYFVIFGRLTIRTKRKVILGGKPGQITIGCTLGEE